MRTAPPGCPGTAGHPGHICAAHDGCSSWGRCSAAAQQVLTPIAFATSLAPWAKDITHAVNTCRQERLGGGVGTPSTAGLRWQPRAWAYGQRECACLRPRAR